MCTNQDTGNDLNWHFLMWRRALIQRWDYIRLLCYRYSWTLLVTYEKALQTFHMKYQHQILDIRWYDFITNSQVSSCTRLIFDHEPRCPASSVSIWILSRYLTNGVPSSHAHKVMMPFDVILDFHPVARCMGREWRRGVVQSTQSPGGTTNSGAVPPPFQLTHSAKQHAVSMEEWHYRRPIAVAGHVTTMTTKYLNFCLICFL